MRVVIDTNIVVSAALKGRDPRDLIQFVIDNDRCDWLVSDQILLEYKNVLSRPKFRLSEEILRNWWEIFDLVTSLIQVDVTIDFPRDRKDAKFLACAIAGQADFLITGDRDFEEVIDCGKTKIISVSQFKSLVMEPLLSQLDVIVDLEVK